MSLVIDVIKAIGGGLVPPMTATDEHIFRYRLAVSASITLGGIVVAGHIAWACGFLSFIGIQGFALASDVQSQSARLAMMQKTQLTRDIRDIKKEQCVAMQQKNQIALTAVTANLEALKAEYRNAVGPDPSVPRCDELLIGASTAD